MEMVSLDVLVGNVPHVPRTMPTRVDAPGVRSTCIYGRCENPDFEYALVSNISYASNDQMIAAFENGDEHIVCTIQAVGRMEDELTLEDYEDAYCYGKSIGWPATVKPWIRNTYADISISGAQPWINNELLREELLMTQQILSEYDAEAWEAWGEEQADRLFAYPRRWAEEQE